MSKIQYYFKHLFVNVPMKKVFYYGGLCLTALFLLVKFVKPNLDSANKKDAPPQYGLSDQQNTDESITDLQQFHKLSVLPQRCIGCGKCARIDSAHFEMSQTTGKATVISSTNLNSQNLVMAIQACPAQAITLE